MAGSGDLAPQCPTYNRAAEIIGSRWAGAVVRAMLAGATRFSEIRDYINGITDRVLSKRLKDLESEGILVRKVFNDTPVRIEYHLTEKGRALARVVDAMTEWADEWLVAPAAAQDRRETAGRK
ncbi:MAG TPA: helix-turn-helix domain-containing protein [Actinomycetota bacterium]|nr:helix-turn-helix domain-containing protein [Actinomycetota bacterium]